MQVVVSKKDLLRVLSRCQGVADKKSTLPVLGNVLLEVIGADTLRLAATDLTVAVIGTIHAQVETRGSIALPARDFLERVKMMPEGQMSIATNGTTATLRASGSARRFTLPGVSGQDFPSLPQAERSATLELDVSTLAALMSATHFSI